MDGRGKSESTGRRRGGRVALVVLLVACVRLVVGADPGAAAERPEAVRDAIVPPGIFVAPELPPGLVDPAALANEVERARGTGVAMVVVVAHDPRPNPDAFALRVRQLGVGDPVLVFGPTGELGVSSDALRSTDLGRATDAAEGEPRIEGAVEAFTSALLEDAEGSVPEVVPRLGRLAIGALIVLVLSALAERALRRRRRRRRGRRPPDGRRMGATS